MNQKQELPVQLKMTYQEVIAVLQQPLKETLRDDGITVLRFGSKATSLADFVFLKDNRVISFSTSYPSQGLDLNQYIPSLGTPETSYLLSEKTNQDKQVLHLWTTKGIGIVTHGETEGSIVERVDRFDSTDVQEYATIWGIELKEENKTTMQTINVTVVSPTPVPTQASVTFIPIGTGRFIFFVVILIGLVVFLKKKRRKSE